MAMNHMNLKRVTHRILEELSATKQIASVCGIRNAILTVRSKIDIQIMNRNGFKEPISVKNRLMKRHEITLKYIENKYSKFLSEYSYAPNILEEKSVYKDKIWICWWQGLEQAPPIVKSCINSIKKIAGNHEIVILTDDNYLEYVDFPEWLIKKKNAGIISRTHYSDLLRLEVLARHGGVWIDSTFFCTEKCNIEEIFKENVWSIKRPDYLHCSIACGQFANYSLACNLSNRRVYAVIRDFLIYWWSQNDSIVDYLLTDYLIVLAMKYDKDVKEKIDSIIPNNPCCDDLFKVLGQPYDDEIWQSLTQDTALFKLSWKHEFPLEKNGVKTFYGKILEETLQ